MAVRELPSSPADVLRLDPAGADRLLGVLEERLPKHAPVVEIPRTAGTSAIVFGDTHGDWSSTLEAVGMFESAGPSSVLVGLGDYVDRPPADLPCGSVANALYLLSLQARLSGRVYLLQGNHETMRRIGARPHTLPSEIARLWGPDPDRYDRLMGLLERGPLAATTASGAYLAHAGFPQGELPRPWTDALARPNDERLLELVWAECDRSGAHRGAVAPWTEADLDRFLGATGLATVWRGHDPDLAGKALYGRRVMTLNTARIYERYGGVLAATLPLDRPLRTVDQAVVQHLRTETRRSS